MLACTSAQHFAFKHFLIPGKCSEEDDGVAGSSFMKTVMFPFLRRLWGHSSQSCGWGQRIPLEHHNLDTEKVKNCTFNAPWHSRVTLDPMKMWNQSQSLYVSCCRISSFQGFLLRKLHYLGSTSELGQQRSSRQTGSLFLSADHLIQLFCFVLNRGAFFPWYSCLEIYTIVSNKEPWQQVL